MAEYSGLVENTGPGSRGPGVWKTRGPGVCGKHGVWKTRGPGVCRKRGVPGSENKTKEKKILAKKTSLIIYHHQT